MLRVPAEYATHVAHTQAAGFLRPSPLLCGRPWKDSAVERSAFVSPVALQSSAVLELKWRNGESNACPFSSNSSHRAFALRRGSRRRGVIKNARGAKRKMGFWACSCMPAHRGLPLRASIRPMRANVHTSTPQNTGKMIEIPSAFKLFDPLQRNLLLMALKKPFKSSQAWTSALLTSYILNRKLWRDCKAVAFYHRPFSSRSHTRHSLSGLRF